MTTLESDKVDRALRGKMKAERHDAGDWYNPMPSQPPGLEGHHQILVMFRNAFPDLQITLEEVIAEGDKVVDRWTMRATHTGPFMNIPPTGKQVTFTGMDIARVENGKIVEYWHQQDGLGLLQQLGVIPTPG